jgi:hypothetical protein
VDQVGTNNGNRINSSFCGSNKKMYLSNCYDDFDDIEMIPTLSIHNIKNVTITAKENAAKHANAMQESLILEISFRIDGVKDCVPSEAGCK